MNPPQTPLRFLISAATILTVALAYSPVWRAGFIWDDDDYVTHNAVLTSPGGLRAIWLDPTATPQYYPMVHTTFWIEHKLWGFNPHGYHAVNVALHALNALLLALVLARMGVRGAVAAGLAFALHPVMVESVAWVTERKNVLSLFFYLIAFGSLGGWLGVVETQLRRGALLYTVALSAFVCALLSKSVTCSLPAAVVLAVWWRRGALDRRAALGLLPFFATGIVAGFVTVWLEKHHVGADRGGWALSILDRIVIAARAPWFYLGKLLWPGPLAFIYPRWSAGGWGAPDLLFIPATTLLLAVAFARARLAGRGPAALLLFFGGTLLPALGFFDVFPFRYSFVADHFQYHASLGIIAAAAIVWTGISSRIVPHGARLTLAAALLIALGIATWSKAAVYYNPETLWTDTLRINPGCPIAHNNLGSHRAAEGKMEEAAEAFARGLDAAPDDDDLRVNLAAAWVELGRSSDAVALLNAAIRPGEPNPWLWNTMGLALQSAGRMDEALDAFRRAAGEKPDMVEAWNNQAALLAAMGRPDAAREILRQALTLNPGHPILSANLRRLETPGVPQEEKGPENSTGAIERQEDLQPSHGRGP